MGATNFPARNRGILFALAAYTCWGFLSPVGQLLLESMGPFTLNALRTLAALPLLVVLFGRRTTVGAWHSLRSDPAVWAVGVLWLGLTFVPYLWSLKYLPPTIATLTVYVSPFFVAAWQRARTQEPVSWLAVPAALLTLAGGWLALEGPGGVPHDRTGLLGLGLASVGVLGWSAYTIHVKILTRTRDANVLTLAAFATSGVAFAAGAAFEGFHVHWSGATAAYFGLYVLFPTALSFWLYTQSLRRVSAVTVSVLLGVELISTAIVSFFLTEEVFTVGKLAGLGVVVLALTAYLWQEARNARHPRTDSGTAGASG